MRWLRWKAFWVRIRWGRWWWLDWILDGREDEIYRRETTGEINEGKYRSKLYNSSMMWRPIMTIIYSCTYSEKFSTKCLSYIHCYRTWKDEEYRLLIPGYIHYTNRHPEDWGTIGKWQSTVFSLLYNFGHLLHTICIRHSIPARILPPYTTNCVAGMRSDIGF